MDLEAFKGKEPGAWTMDDVIAWMVGVARKYSIPIEVRPSTGSPKVSPARAGQVAEWSVLVHARSLVPEEAVWPSGLSDWHDWANVCRTCRCTGSRTARARC